MRRGGGAYVGFFKYIRNASDHASDKLIKKKTINGYIYQKRKKTPKLNMHVYITNRCGSTCMWHNISASACK